MQKGTAAAATCAGWGGSRCKAPGAHPGAGEATPGGCAERLAGASPLRLGSICLPRALIMGPHQGSDAELPEESEMGRTCPPSPPMMTFHAHPSWLKLQARSTVAAFKVLMR